MDPVDLEGWLGTGPKDPEVTGWPCNNWPNASCTYLSIPIGTCIEAVSPLGSPVGTGGTGGTGSEGRGGGIWNFLLMYLLSGRSSASSSELNPIST